jgi:hypothetical protein
MRTGISPLLVLAAFLVLYPARAADTNAAPVKIGAVVADQHYGENLIVTGKVVQVTIRPRAVFLNFDQPYPDSPFTGVIFSRSTNQFADLLSLKGASVEVSGMVTNYQNKPEIVLTNARQLTITAPGTEEQKPVPAQVNASAPAPTAAPPADATAPEGHPQTMLWLSGLLAGCLALFLVVRLFARRPALQLVSLPVQSGQIIDTEAVRAGVIANLSRWLKQNLVRRLVSDREQLLATQQAAALKVLAVDERLARIEQHIEQRNQDYERRIDDLLKALITAEAENREMIRAQITFLKSEMDKARLKAQQQSEEHQQF